MGDDMGAVRLWTSAVEIRHNSLGVGCRWSAQEGSHRLGGHHAWMPRVPAAPSSVVVSNSLGWGIGQGGGFWWRMQSRLLRHGRRWPLQMISWTSCWWRRMEVASLPRTLPLLGWKWCWSARGTSVAPQMQQQWWKHGSAGSLGALDGWTPDRTIRHGWMLGPIHEPEPNEPWQAGWKTLGSRADLCQRLASGVEEWRPSGAVHVARVNVATVLAGKGWTPAAKGQPQATRHGRQSGHDWGLLILGATSLVWTFFGGHAVQCGVDGAASSSSNLTALNASEMVIAARTKQWRVQPLWKTMTTSPTPSPAMIKLS